MFHIGRKENLFYGILLYLPLILCKNVSNQETLEEDGINANNNHVQEDLPSVSSLDPVESVLIVALGGGDDEIYAAHVSSLLSSSGIKVAVVVYGPGPREEQFPNSVQLIELEALEEDSLYQNGGISPETIGSSSQEWIPGMVVSSRLSACHSLVAMETLLRDFAPKVLITPLFLHDVCVLTLAKRLKVPVIGTVTSRTGSWWVRSHLEPFLPLTTTAVPLNHLDPLSMWSRLYNLVCHYNYMATVRQQWQARAQLQLPENWQQFSLVELYSGLTRVVVAWDSIIDRQIHPSSFVFIGGFSSFTGGMSKDILVPALMNRAGVVVVSPGGKEIWLGPRVVKIMTEALSAVPHTIVWKALTERHLPSGKANQTELKKKFVVRATLPLNDILGHPRHRLLVSTCSEMDVMAALYFASPIFCIPVTSDQVLAAKEVALLGIGESLPAADVTEESLQNLLKKIIGNRRYRERARECAEELHDQDTSPRERLLFHVQHVMRRPQSLRYRISRSELALLQQTNADVFFVLLVCIILLVGGLVGACLHFSTHCCRQRKKGKKE